MSERVAVDANPSTLARLRVAVQRLTGRHVTGETPAGDIDGVNDEFTLKWEPQASTLAVYKSGARLANGDFTVAGHTLTLASPPAIGEWLMVDYRK